MGRPAGDPIDDICATCVAVSQNGETFLIYTLDLLAISPPVLQAQDRICDVTGIPKENIILSATHTHSAPAVDHNSCKAYREPLWDACADAAVAAIADLSPAEIYYGDTQTENLCFVRHYKLENGEIYGVHQSLKHAAKGAVFIKEHTYEANTTMQVIKFARTAEDKKDVVMMNLGAHPTMVSGNSRFNISSDWPGIARAYVEENSDSLCAVFLAAAGDQASSSSIPNESVYKGANEHRDYGGAAGKYCVDVLNSSLVKAQDGDIVLSVKKYTGLSNKEGIDDPVLFEKAKAIKDIERQYGSSSDQVKDAVLASPFDSYYHANALLKRASLKENITIELHTLAIGDVSMVFAPYEMFSQIGSYITENSPYEMTFVISCSESFDGHAGYLPTVYAYENNFYEYAQTRFARGTAEELAKLHVEILTELKGEG